MVLTIVGTKTRSGICTTIGLLAKDYLRQLDAVVIADVEEGADGGTVGSSLEVGVFAVCFRRIVFRTHATEPMKIFPSPGADVSQSHSDFSPVVVAVGDVEMTTFDFSDTCLDPLQSRHLLVVGEVFERIVFHRDFNLSVDLGCIDDSEHRGVFVEIWSVIACRIAEAVEVAALCVNVDAQAQFEQSDKSLEVPPELFRIGEPHDGEATSAAGREGAICHFCYFANFAFQVLAGLEVRIVLTIDIYAYQAGRFECVFSLTSIRTLGGYDGTAQLSLQFGTLLLIGGRANLFYYRFGSRIPEKFSERDECAGLVGDMVEHRHRGI